MAFQITDDVLDLRGFVGDGKTRDEDITAGKVTFPIAMAMRDAGTVNRYEIWDILGEKTGDAFKVQRCISLVEEVEALENSCKYAVKMVEEAWVALDSVLEDSYYKVLLRAFGFYVLERH